MVDSKQQIIQRLQESREEIRALGVRRIGLFGSFLRGAQTPESDVDVLVEFQPGQKSFDRFMELAFLLEGLFQRRVELVTPESLSPYLGPKILAGAQNVLEVE